MNMKPTLLGLHARIMAAIMPRDLANIVVFELLPLLREQGPLKAAYDVRIHYYDRLSKDKQYLLLIQSIHALMKDVHQLVDPSKFPKNAKQKFLHQKENDRRSTLIPAEELYPLLIQKDQWQYLGHVKEEFGTKDSILCPWVVIVMQYSIVGEFTRYAIEVGAAGETARYYVRELRATYQKIKQLLQDPFKRLHIQEFEYFHMRTQEPDKLLAEWNPGRMNELREAANCVCHNLLSALDIFEAEEQSVSLETGSELQKIEASLTDWTGDQPISYKDGLLKVGSLEAKPVPEKEKSEFRRVLLELLVQEYQQAGEGMGITPNVFATRLHEIGFEPKGRALQTATQDINDEIENAFNLKKFIRMRGGAALIFKKREAAVLTTASNQLHTAV